MSDGALTARHELAELAEQVRADATARGAAGASLTSLTLDGEVTLDYRTGDFLRITLRGDGPERTHVLAPGWGAA